MDGIVSNDVTKRLLPSWMLGVASVEKGRVGDSRNDSDNRDRDVDDGCGVREEGQKIENRGGRRPKLKVAVVREKQDEFSDGLELEQGNEESSALVVKPRGGKRKKRKINLDIEETPKKKRKNRKDRANRNSQSIEDGVTGCCSENGDDEDFLTVEDLMFFAKECVQGDNIGTKKVELMKEDDFGDTTVQSGNSIDVQENKRESETEEIINSSGVTTRNVNVTSEGSDCKLSMSGDPTKDMLDLLLGPLLKKAEEKGKKKVDLINEMDIINFEMKRKEQDMGAGLGQEQATTIVTNKKKTSLRDQVAMFLD